MPATAPSTRTTIAMATVLLGLGFWVRPAAAQHSATASIQVAATVIRPVQPEVMHDALQMLTNAVDRDQEHASGFRYADRRHGAQVTVSPALPESGRSPASAHRTVTIAFPGT